MMKREKLVLYLLIITLLLNTLFIDNSVPNGASPIKDLLFILIIACGTLTSLALIFLKPQKLNFQWYYIDIVIFIFLVVWPVALLLSEHSQLLPTCLSISYFLAYFLVRLHISGKSPEMVMGIFKRCLFVELGLQCAIYLAQHIIGYLSFGNLHTTGAFFNSGPFSIYISSILSFLIISATADIIPGHKFKNYLKGLVYITALLIILANLSRSAFIGLICSMCVCLSLSRPKWARKNKLKLLFSSVLIIVSFLFICRFSYSEKDGSAKGRMLIWRVCYSMQGLQMITGYGLGNFQVNYMEYQARLLKSDHNRSGYYAGEISYPFNDLVLITIERGIPGLILFAIIIFNVFRITMISAKKVEVKGRMLTLPAFGILIVIIVSGLSSYPMSSSPIQAFFWIAVGIIVSANKDLQPSVQKIHDKRYFLIAIFAFTAFLAVYSLFTTYAYVKWINIEETETDDKKEIELASFFPQLRENSTYLCQLGDLYFNREDFDRAIIYYQMAAKISTSKEINYSLGYCYEETNRPLQAENEFMQVKERVPNLLTPIYLLAKLYFRSNQKAKFNIMANQIELEKPKIYSLETEVMQREIKILANKININSISK